LQIAGLKELAAMIGMAPANAAKLSAYTGRRLITPTNPRARVVLMSGCAQRVLRPETNDATIRLLTAAGVEVVQADHEGCCGALVQHMGHEDEARNFARRNIVAWEKAIASAPLDAILITTSGCGTTVKDYGHLLGHDAAFAVRARRIAALAMDVTEFLTDRLDLGAPHGWSDIRVAYHSACSLQHGQRVNTQPRQLLSTAGFTVAEIPEGHLCCGSAGAYNILQPEIASQLRARKLGHIASVKPDCIATGNIGCLNQLSGDDAPPVVHTIELIDWAYGGKCPAELTHLKGRMRLMTEMFGAKAENQAAPV
jgi:glycolate oxidase iron-sulfur subunit